MKTILILLLSGLCLTASAQKTAKIYAKAQKALDQHDYYDVLDYMDKLPKEEKSTATYNKYMAVALDSLKRYGKAITYYEVYTDISHDSVAGLRLAEIRAIEQKRIAAWQAKLVRIKNCPKCLGTDTVVTESNCMQCGGNGQIRKPCSRCRGVGTVACGSCGGKGSLASQDGPIPCGSCGGTGTKQCNNCDRGYKDESCNGCNGSGRAVYHQKCDLHE